MDSYIQKGDLIIFDDKHYLYCGDSTDEKSYQHIKEQATMTLTSPPYNVGKNNYGSTSKCEGQKYLSKQDDIMSDEDYFNLMSKVLEQR